MPNHSDKMFSPVEMELIGRICHAHGGKTAAYLSELMPFP